HAHVEVKEWKIRICRLGFLEFRQSFPIVGAVQKGLAQQQVKLGFVFADFREAGARFLVELGIPGVIGRDSKNVEIGEVDRHLRPEKLERFCRVGKSAGEGVAESQEKARLSGM